MAVMAVEAPLEVVAGAELASTEAAASSAGARAATRKGGGRTGGYFGGITAPPRGAQAARASTPAAKGSGRKKAASGFAASQGVEHMVNRRKHVDPTEIDLGTGWHRVVMAEFICAIFILVFAPILTPDEASTGGSKGFFRAADLVRMTAVCLVYFILALLANGQRVGKPAAAFGGLVLTGVVYNNATGTQSIFAAVSAIFTSAFGADPISDIADAPADPDLVYGQVGANIFNQLSMGGTPPPGASATPPPALETPIGIAPFPGGGTPVTGGGSTNPVETPVGTSPFPPGA